MCKVSVVVAYHNEEKYLRQCIESVVNQTYKNLELILVNDGSYDKSIDISERLAEKDVRIKNVSIENSGVSVARNRGLEASTGDYIMFIDGDDWIEENTLEYTVKKIQETDSDVFIFSYFQSFKNRQVPVPLISKDNKEYISQSDKQELYMKSIYGGYGERTSNEFVSAGAGSTMCKLYRSHIIKDNKVTFDPSLIRAEDVVFALEVFHYAKKINYANKSLYHYRKTEDSAVSPKHYMSDADFKYGLLLQRLLDFEKNFINKEDFYKVYYARTIQALLWHLKHKYYHAEHPKKKREMKREVMKLIKTNPFKSALSKVDRSLLPKQERVMVNFFQKNLIIVYYFFQKALDLRGKVKNGRYD